MIWEGRERGHKSLNLEGSASMSCRLGRFWIFLIPSLFLETSVDIKEGLVSPRIHSLAFLYLTSCNTVGLLIAIVPLHNMTHGFFFVTRRSYRTPQLNPSPI